MKRDVHLIAAGHADLGDPVVVLPGDVFARSAKINAWDIRNALIDHWLVSHTANAPRAVADTDEWILRAIAADYADTIVGLLAERVPLPARRYAP